MPSLEDHFRALTQIRPPDEWPELEGPPARPLHDSLDLPREEQKRQPRTRPLSPRSHRVAAAAAAITVAAAGSAVAIWAFGSRLQTTPVRPGATVENGQIAFVGEVETNLYVGGTQSGIFVMNPDGSGDTPLIDDTRAFVSDPAWSADGAKIAFGLSGEAAESPAGLYIADADGSDVTLLFEDDTGATSPTWSPDGRTIVFESGLGHEQTGAGDRDIYAIDGETGEVTRLTDDPARDEYPALSPDGTRIAFTRRQGGVADIYLMNADGTDVTQLMSGEGSDLRPVWSPDGTKIAFDRDGDIYVMNADGSGVIRLTGGPAEEREPAWSPDGTRIAYERDGDIYVMDVDGTRVTSITESPRTESSPSWQPVPAAAESPTVMPTPPEGRGSLVSVPDLIGLERADAVGSLEEVGLTVQIEGKGTGTSPPGTIVDQQPAAGTPVEPGTPVALVEARGLYPRGYFDWCPAVGGSPPVGPDSAGEAEQVALRFSRAFLTGEWDAARRLLDSSATPLRPDTWAVAGEAEAIAVLGSRAGSAGPGVTYGCGPRVAARSWAVTIDDGTDSASLDFVLYLVRRATGWMVWASY